MTNFTDYDCGIREPHRHTGEMHEAYYIQYWCPTLVAWIGSHVECECSEPHLRARTQSETTEIIEIYETEEQLIKYGRPFYRWLKEEMRKMYAQHLEEVINGFLYGNNISDGDEGDRDADSSESGTSERPRGDWYSNGFEGRGFNTSDPLGSSGQESGPDVASHE